MQKKRLPIKIDLKSLQSYEILIAELTNDQKFEDYDLSTIELQIFKKRCSNGFPDEALKKALKNLETHIARYGNITIGKRGLSELMNVSRPTLDKWGKLGFISGDLDNIWEGCVKFDTEEALKQLKTLVAIS